MFSNLRPGSQLYILHKGTTPYIEIGQVVAVSQPLPRYQNNNFLTPQELVVDITVSVGNSNITLQKLPANLDVADQGTANGAIFISTTRDAMNNEISALKQKSLDIINSIDYHKSIIQDCETLLQKLNPEFAEQKQQKQEIDNLKVQMSEMMKEIKELMGHIKENT
jgi:hypothetical protein